MWTLSEEQRNELSAFSQQDGGGAYCADCVNRLLLHGPSGLEEAQGVLPMSAVESHESRMTFAYVAERKGPVGSATRRLFADLDCLGLWRLVLKSDQEPAILAAIHAVREL